MKFVERAVIALLCVGMLFALHQVIGRVVTAHHWKGLDPSDWAAWVQAVGSIAAIWGAYSFTAKQHKDSIQRDDRNRNAERSRRAETIQFVMCNAEIHSVRLRNFVETNMAHEAVHFDRAMLRDCADVMEGIPVLDYPDASLAVHCRTYIRHFRAVEEYYERRAQVTDVDFDEIEQMLASSLDTEIDHMVVAAKSAYEQATYLIAFLAPKI